MLNSADQTFILVMILLSYSVAIPLRTALFSVAPAALAGVGAFISAVLVMKHGFSIAEGMALATITCALLGAVTAVPLRRIRGLYTAIATLALVVIATGLESTLNVTGNGIGLVDVPFSDLRFVLIAAVILSAATWWWVDHSHLGRRLDLVRHDVVLAATSGVHLARYRVAALTVSAGLAGFAGAAYAHSFYFLDSTAFDTFFTVNIVAYAMVGGGGYWAGPLLGAGLLSYLSVGLRAYPSWPHLIVGLVMAAVVVFYPGGIGAALRRLLRYRNGVARASRESGGGGRPQMLEDVR